jgi:hypothetical protein
MTFTSLLRIRSAAARGPLAPSDLDQITRRVLVPVGNDFGLCLHWVRAALEHLQGGDIITITNIDELMKEFCTFAAGNRRFAVRNLYPNLMVSQFCS